MSTYCFCPLLSPDEGMLEARKLMSRAKDAEISLLKARSEDDKLVHGSMTYVHLTPFCIVSARPMKEVQSRAIQASYIDIAPGM